MLPTADSLEGRPVPQATFKTRLDNQWRDLTTDDLFKGKTVVVFSLPGAYTPTCSSTHLPRFNELAPVFRQNGIDDIVCFSVNDAFVMNEWKQGQEADGITFVPDGNGDFARGMGMLVDKRDLGFGMRSWRYSMLVRDGVIEKMFIEEEAEGDPFAVSDADTMLRHVNRKRACRSRSLSSRVPAARSAPAPRRRCMTATCAIPKFRRTRRSIPACCAPSAAR